MWLCSEEVEEKPRLHTLHLKGLLELQARGESAWRGACPRGRGACPRGQGACLRAGYLCVFRWIFRWSEREKAASHSWQLYFLSPVSGGGKTTAEISGGGGGRWRRRAPTGRSGPPTCVQLDVAVPAALVLEQATAEGAFERQLVAVDLLVALQVAQAAAGRTHS